MITGKIENLLEGYPLTPDQKAELVSAIRALILDEQLAAVATLEEFLGAYRTQICGDLSNRSIRQLQQLAREKGVAYRNLSKAELIKALTQAGAEG